MHESVTILGDKCRPKVMEDCLLLHLLVMEKTISFMSATKYENYLYTVRKTVTMTMKLTYAPYRKHQIVHGIMNPSKIYYIST